MSQSLSPNQIRNLAIVAHVDHGKTTLVDAMLEQAGTFRENEAQPSRIMDSNELEKERGITILSKNTAIHYKDHKINIVDTPGHADFGGEVERILKMVDGILLVVDAHDGPMPQTRFVLEKAMGLNLPVLLVVNKVDRRDARPIEVIDMVLDLFIELGADDDQLEFPYIFASAREGIASQDFNSILDGSSQDLYPLLDMILEELPAPEGDAEAPFQVLISNIEADPYLGRLAIGKIAQGQVHVDEHIVRTRWGEDFEEEGKITALLVFESLQKKAVSSASTGEIVCIGGLKEINIGDTLTALEGGEPIHYVDIDEPTLSMSFQVNKSPFAGREGKYLTSRHLRARLEREMDRNVAMRLEETDTPDNFVVKGRGELHFSILIETMRREGYEFEISKPQIITRQGSQGLEEPVELVQIDLPETYMGTVIEALGKRKAEMVDMRPLGNGRQRLMFKVPTRGLLGYRTEFLTATRGEGVMDSSFSGFEPWKGEITGRQHGALVSWETGEATTYGLYSAQERGELFIGAGTEVYEGMIVGQNPRNEDVAINVCRKKHVTNMRASGSDEALRLSPPIVMSIENCLEFVADDELIEVTPESVRLRKSILNTSERTKLQTRKRRAAEA